MAGVRSKGKRAQLKDDATDREMFRSARIAVQSLAPEKRTKLANMLMSAYDWRRKVKEWET